MSPRGISRHDLSTGPGSGKTIPGTNKGDITAGGFGFVRRAVVLRLVPEGGGA